MLAGHVIIALFGIQAESERERLHQQRSKYRGARLCVVAAPDSPTSFFLRMQTFPGGSALSQNLIVAIDPVGPFVFTSLLASNKTQSIWEQSTSNHQSNIK
jgi:hypothetical protein